VALRGARRTLDRLEGAHLLAERYHLPLRSRLAAISIACLLAFAGLTAVCQVALAAGPKRVMLLHSFGRDFTPWNNYSRAIRVELSLRSPWSIDIIDHSLVTARFGGEAHDIPLIDYLNAAHADNPLDLIVTVGAPAAWFVQRNRQRLFPAVPLLVAAVEQRRVQYSRVTENDVIVAVRNDFSAFFENILRVLPSTEAVSVVIGNSPLEKFWLEDIRKEIGSFESRIAFTFYNDLSFDEVLKRAAALPPNSVIYWHVMSVDAADVAHEGVSAFDRLRAVASVPIFTYQEVFFGRGNVGGPMRSVVEESQQTATIALRLLAGEKAADLRLAPLEFARPKFDWRELQRWGIPQSRLPAGSQIEFRESAIWEQYRLQIIGVCTALLVQTALISWLVYEHRRRLLAEIQARNAIVKLTYMDRLATAGELSASIAHEVNQPLTGITTRASAALRWLAPDTLDLDNARAALIQIVAAGERAGDIVSGVRAMFKKQPTEPTRIDINKLVRTVLQIVRVELQKHDVTLNLQLEDIPSVQGDEIQLQQVLVNLIMNAVDAMNSVRPRVLSIRTAVRGDDAVRVSVEDTGTGIDPANIDNVFKTLFTTKTRGMGMGLSICRSIIDHHGGRIWVSPGVATGSSFQFELPAAPASS
jgi:signal transduction histidine kinase